MDMASEAEDQALQPQHVTGLVPIEDILAWDNKWEAAASERLNDHISLLDEWVESFVGISKHKFKSEQGRLAHMEAKISQVMGKLQTIVEHAGNRLTATQIKSVDRLD